VPKDSIASADLILYNGYNLAGADYDECGRNQSSVSGEALQLDKAGDTVPDPHVWGDVENAIAMVNAIQTP